MVLEGVKHGPVRSVYLDTGFLQKLVRVAKGHKSGQATKWQSFYFDKLNNELLPFRAEPTCFNVLEVLGVTNFKRFDPGNYLEKVASASADKKGGEELDKVFFEALSEAEDFYSQLIELQQELLIDKLNLASSKYWLQVPGVRLLIDAFIRDVLGRKRFKDDLHLSLFLDDLQKAAARIRTSGDKAVIVINLLLAQLEFLHKKGYRAPTYRLYDLLLRSQVEKEILLSGRKSPIPRVKSHGDRCDCEYLLFAVFGIPGNKNPRQTVVFTCDSADSVRKRVNMYLALINSRRRNALEVEQHKEYLSPPNTCFGLILCCGGDAVAPTEIRVAEVDGKLEYDDDVLKHAFRIGRGGFLATTSSS